MDETGRTAPEAIGPYRILGELGHGGMGDVYLAEQRDPIQRRVALKLIRRGLDTREVLARFALERQALALMEHDGIARIFDAGETDDGRAYFAMEYVRGLPITRFCEERLPGVADRVDLVRQTCLAIAHAHSRGVIHRDLKPANILVTTRNDRPVVKIIDFGLARATNARQVEQTYFTEFGRVLGTPEYMSPEQADLTALDLDARTDVYALGAILYELLTGEPPIPRSELFRAGLLEMQRKIRELEPERPSTRVSTKMHAPEASEQVQAIARSRVRAISGDLDWITLRALAKERTRRYGSAEAFADDLGRHLRGEPVEASPPSLSYRVGRILRRTRPYLAPTGLAAASAAAVVTTLALATAPATLTAGADVAHVTIRHDADGPVEIRSRRLVRSPDGYGTAMVHGSTTGDRLSIELPAGRYRIDVLASGRRTAELTRTVTAPGHFVFTARPRAAEDDLVRIDAGAIDIELPTTTAPSVAELIAGRARHEAFWICRDEVTNLEFLEYLEETAPNEAAAFRRALRELGPASAWEDLPVTGIDWHTAQAFAEWRGMRLPTAGEWAFAAQGGPQDTWLAGVLAARERPDDLNVGRPLVPRPSKASYLENATAAVGEGYGTYRLRQTLGNVIEWTETRCSADREPTSFALAGCSWDYGWDEIEASALASFGRMAAATGGPMVGFRCAKSDF